jgi:hypothetical protein
MTSPVSSHASGPAGTISAEPPDRAADAAKQLSAAEHPDPTCACGHLLDQHDPIASRYCDATNSARLERGCVCSAAPGVYPGRM